MKQLNNCFPILSVRSEIIKTYKQTAEQHNIVQETSSVITIQL